MPYEFTQGWKEPNIEIFMPVYEGNLQQLINQFRFKRSEVERRISYSPKLVPHVVKGIAQTMFFQVLLALNHVHSYTPQIIHRDVKPANIFYQGGKFFLTDFGIAKAVITSTTYIGTRWFSAPEIHERGEQTSKVDIYGLGATLVDCLAEFPDDSPNNWREWHQFLQKLLDQHAPCLAPILADRAHERPTARQLLQDNFLQAPHSLRNETTTPNFKAPPPTKTQINGTIVTSSTFFSEMDWIRTVAEVNIQGSAQQNDVSKLLKSNLVADQSILKQPAQPGSRRKASVKSLRSTNKRQKNGHGRKRSSQNESQYAGIPKRTASRRKQRSISNNIHKAQDIRVLGKA